MRRAVLFVNTRSGGGTARRARIAEHARERGIEAVVLEPDQSLSKLAGEAVTDGADALGMAGGDGSLGVVAEAARRHGLPFVCIPAGTRNHFAADLAIDRDDPIGALDAFTDAAERPIDVGKVNGRMFLNNVSLGVYGDAVRQPAYRDAKLRTLLKTANAAHSSIAEAPPLSLADDRGREHVRPAVVLVSNNPYALDLPGRGLDRAEPGGAGRGARTRRGRRRGCAYGSAFAVRDRTRRAPGQDLLAPRRRSVVTTSGASAAPVSEPTSTSPG